MQIPPGFDLRALEVFCAVARAGGMTAAARELSLSQSTVSQTVAQLEAALGAALLDRSVRPPALTRAGHALREAAEGLLRDALAALHHSADGSARQPILRLAMVDSFAAVVGPPLVLALRQRARHWRVWSGLSPDHRRALSAHDVDFIIGDHGGAQARWLHLPILEEPFLLVLPAGDDGPRDNLRQLADRLPLVRYSLRSRIGRQVEAHLEACGVSAPMGMELDTAPAQLAMIGAGLGWGLTTALCALQAGAALERVQLQPLPGPPLARQIALSAHPGPLAGVAQALAQTSRQLLKRALLPPLTARFAALAASPARVPEANNGGD